VSPTVNHLQLINGERCDCADFSIVFGALDNVFPWKIPSFHPAVRVQINVKGDCDILSKQFFHRSQVNDVSNLKSDFSIVFAALKYMALMRIIENDRAVKDWHRSEKWKIVNLNTKTQPETSDYLLENQLHSDFLGFSLRCQSLTA